MAIFERKIKRKPVLDETQSLICTIETAQEVNGHTVRTNFIILNKNYIDISTQKYVGHRVEWALAIFKKFFIYCVQLS